MAESLKAMAMEELNQLADDLKEQAKGAVSDLMEEAEEAGAGGLLEEMGGLLMDAAADKRSRMETWRVREVAATCARMLAVAPQIRGALAEKVQGGLVRRRAFETNDKVLAVMGAGSELPKRLVDLLPMMRKEGESGIDDEVKKSKSKREDEGGIDDEVKRSKSKVGEDNEDGKMEGGTGDSTTAIDEYTVAGGKDDEYTVAGAAGGKDDEYTAARGKDGDPRDDLDAAQCAMALQKDAIAADLARRMAALRVMEEEARNETNGVNKGVLLVKARMESNALTKQVQNSADLGSKVTPAPTPRPRPCVSVD